MTQRYIVFLNERVVIIQQDINKPDPQVGEIHIIFSEKYSLTDTYEHFKSKKEYTRLYIKSSENFKQACKVFNGMFNHIEAAGGIVRNVQKDYLFIKRLGLWDLPKGKLHKKESAEAGAIREVSEETGLSGLRIIKQLPSTFHIYTDRKGKEILKETFWFEMAAEKEQPLSPQIEEDITEVRWFKQNELSIPLLNTYSSLRYLFDDYLADQ
jgi:8-oxo-dGTP pyrophosphatase MutT (NUDIX family)